MLSKIIKIISQNRFLLNLYILSDFLFAVNEEINITTTESLEILQISRKCVIVF